MENKHEPADKQFLSELLDNEASNESIDKLLADKPSGEAFYRYQTVQSILKEEHSALSTFSFTQAVSAKIALEPSHSLTESSENNDSVQVPEHADNVVELNAWQGWRRMGGGLAVAASVAFAMVFSVQFGDSQIENPLNSQPSFAVEQDSNQLFELTPADTEEQAKLDEIQRVLELNNRKTFQLNEQYVGGNDVVVKSYVVEKKDNIGQFQQSVRSMRKPSEMVEDKDDQ